YADSITDSMRVAIDETKRRRAIQNQYNEEHGITPKTIQKAVQDVIAISKKVAKAADDLMRDPEDMDVAELEKLATDLKKKMDAAAADLNFEVAAEYRDQLIEIKNMLRDLRVDAGNEKRKKR
ncbi:MAG: UvrB/UvrC motif-containing protein, partial [Lachnospiraceae bacterium]|nr:UvrB/UvrC motif-containing protein [Lachnospiraceae bacterium]